MRHKEEKRRNYYFQTKLGKQVIEDVKSDFCSLSLLFFPFFIHSFDKNFFYPSPPLPFFLASVTLLSSSLPPLLSLAISYIPSSFLACFITILSSGDKEYHTLTFPLGRSSQFQLPLAWSSVLIVFLCVVNHSCGDSSSPTDFFAASPWIRIHRLENQAKAFDRSLYH